VCFIHGMTGTVVPDVRWHCVDDDEVNTAVDGVVVDIDNVNDDVTGDDMTSVFSRRQGG